MEQGNAELGSLDSRVFCFRRRLARGVEEYGRFY